MVVEEVCFINLSFFSSEGNVSWNDISFYLLLAAALDFLGDEQQGFAVG